MRLLKISLYYLLSGRKSRQYLEYVTESQWSIAASNTREAACLHNTASEKGHAGDEWLADSFAGGGADQWMTRPVITSRFDRFTTGWQRESLYSPKRHVGHQLLIVFAILMLGFVPTSPNGIYSFLCWCVWIRRYNYTFTKDCDKICKDHTRQHFC